MTPLCKVEVTLPRVLGSREVRRGGGVDEARFDKEIRQTKNCMTTAENAAVGPRKVQN